MKPFVVHDDLLLLLFYSDQLVYKEFGCLLLLGP